MPRITPSAAPPRRSSARTDAPCSAGTPLTINGKQVSTGRIAMKNQTASVSKTVADQTVAAGQDASYTITTAIPNYVGYKVQGYQFTVSDTFDANAPLSYKPGTLTVKVGGQVLTADKDYTVTGFGATSKTFTIDLNKYITANGFFGTSAPKPESTFTDADLVGKTVVAILNLPPRKMMGQMSNGMLLSAVREVDGKEELHLLMLDDSVPAGSQLC